MTDEVDDKVKEPEVKERIKLHLPHPAFHCPKVKKHHYRRCLMLSILALPFAHMLTPEMECVAAVVNGLFFYYEPILAVEAEV